MTDPIDPESDITPKHSFVWRVEHTVAVVLFALGLLGFILYWSLA